MILFALAMEPLIRHLESLLEDGDTLGVYADDIASVLADIRVSLPRILDLFPVFASLSNLHLNLRKCCIVPLCPTLSRSAFIDVFHASCPVWSHALAIVESAEYLGFLLGPGGANLLWNGPASQARDTILKCKNCKAVFVL